MKNQLDQVNVDQNLIDSVDKDPDLERIRLANLAFNNYKKPIETDNNEITSQTYENVELLPNDFAKMINVDKNGRNTSKKYSKITYSSEQE